MFTKIVEKKQVIPPVTPIPLPNTEQKYKDLSGNLKASSTVQENFFLNLGGGDIPYDSSDNTVLWRYNIPTLVPGERRRVIQILSMTALLINYQSTQFPLKLGLQASGINGFQSLKYIPPVDMQPGSWQTVPTDVVAWSVAKAITGVKQTATTAYNVSYEITEDQTWQIGMTSVLQLRILDNDLNRIAGPFNNPIQLHLRILHLGQ